MTWLKFAKRAYFEKYCPKIKLSTFFIIQKPSLKSPPSVLSQGATMSNFQAKYNLSPGFWDHTILISGNSSRLSWGMSPGGPGPEPLRAAPAGVHPGWGVIGLSHRLACFPMWATAVGRPKGTIWKQHDTLQCRTGIHCSGYRDQGPGTRNTKLKQRCLSALKRLPFGLLLTVGSICGWKSEVIEFWFKLFFINVLLNSKGNELESFSKVLHIIVVTRAPGWTLDFPRYLK